MSIRAVRLSAILLLLVFGIATSETKTPLSFWRDFVKGPLTGPNADELFVNQYKDAFFPGRDTAYLEGSVVSVVRTPSNARKLLLSMERMGLPMQRSSLTGASGDYKGSRVGTKNRCPTRARLFASLAQLGNSRKSHFWSPSSPNGSSSSPPKNKPALPDKSGSQVGAWWFRVVSPLRRSGARGKFQHTTHWARGAEDRL